MDSFRRWIQLGNKQSQTHLRYYTMKNYHQHRTISTSAVFCQTYSNFQERHIGPRKEEIKSMLQKIGFQVSFCLFSLSIRK